jgi:phage/plasmid-associated DNA primase
MTLPFEFKSQEKIDQAPARDRKWLKVGDPAMSDRKWQAANIAPAFFNVLCDRAISVLNKGTIDWSCCEHERSGLVDKSDHVRGFLESEYVVVTPDGAEGFIGSVALYELYKRFCESIDRAEITPAAEFLDADPRSKESKADPLCMTSAAFSRRLLGITKNSFRGISKTSKWCSRTSKAVKGFAGLEAPASKK